MNVEIVSVYSRKWLLPDLVSSSTDIKLGPIIIQGYEYGVK